MLRAIESAALVLMIVLLAGPGYGETASKLVQNLEAGRKQVIVAYGTSLTAGGAWVKQLSEILEKRFPGQTTIINSGGSGQWSQWGVQNLDARVLAAKPDAVFIEFEINDSVARFHCSIEKSRKNHEDMIRRILERNPQCQIILVTTTPGNKYPENHMSHRKDTPAYYEMYRALAKEHKLLLVDIYPKWKALQENDTARFDRLVPDTIHPTAAGCAEVVTPAIVEALGLQAKPEK